MKYSQSEEDEYIVKYFLDFKGTLLSIGENNGITFSNALRLIRLGWKAHLFEPCVSAFNDLQKLHEGNTLVNCYPLAVSNKYGTELFHESGSHLPDKSDFGLLSTLNQEEKNRWNGVEFKEYEVATVPASDLLAQCEVDCFDFISLDAEGLDVLILKQLNLSQTKLICIEWNSIESVKSEIIEYCNSFGLEKLIYQSGENLIIGR